MKPIFVFLLVILPWLTYSGDNKWTSTGPFGGRILSFAFHPQKNNLIIANGELGTFRSRDGGNTWQRLNVYGIVGIHPKAAQKLIAAGSSVFSSTDDGTSWEEMARNPFGDSAVDLEFDPANPLVVYVLTGGFDRSGVFKSTDGGRTWTRKSKGLPSAQGFHLAVDPKNGRIVYASMGYKIYKTTNGGDSWRSAANGLTQELSAFAIDPNNPQTLYAASYDVFKTTNGGNQWSRISTLGGGAIDFVVDPRNSDVLFAVGFGRDQNAWRSQDGGTTWTEMIVDPDELQSIAVHPKAKNVVFVGGTDQGVFRSQDSGRSWRQVNGRVDAYRVKRISANSKRMVACGSGLTIFQSLNGGLTWQRLSFGLGDSLAMDAEVHSKTADLIVAAGAFGRCAAVAISRDGGKNWEFPSPFTMARWVRLDPENPEIIYVADDGAFSDLRGVAKSTDQGKTWKVINSGLADRDVSEFAIDPGNGSKLYVGTESGKIFVTSNGGNTWKNKSSGLSGENVSSIAVDPSASTTVYSVVQDLVYKHERRLEVDPQRRGFEHRCCFDIHRSIESQKCICRSVWWIVYLH